MNNEKQFNPNDIKPLTIINESQESLHKVCEQVKTPINEEDFRLLISLLRHVMMSQDEQYSKMYKVRPGVGLACPQIGINKRMFAIHAHGEDGVFTLAIINPKIVSTNKELVYLPGGEGCLSVDRPTEGITPRYSKITIEGFIYDFKKKQFNKKKMTLKDYYAIVFQHEYDHLDGILYVDKLMSEEEAKLKKIAPLWEIEDLEEDEK